MVSFAIGFRPCYWPLSGGLTDTGTGAGRRLCPGIHLAERNLFAALAKLLWAFSFEKEVDENGRVMEPDTNYATGWNEGLVTCTKNFPCRVVPRSPERVETIMREFAQAEADVFIKYD